MRAWITVIMRAGITVMMILYNKRVVIRSEIFVRSMLGITVGIRPGIKVEMN